MKTQPIEEWLRWMVDLVVVAGCVMMVTPPPKPEQIVSDVALNEPVETKPQKKGNVSPEVQEFKRLPLHIQKQALGYARKWIDANFEFEKEGEDGDKGGTDAVQGGRG